MKVREIPTWFAIAALGVPLAFVMWAGCGGATTLMGMLP